MTLPTGPRVNKRGQGVDAAIADATEMIAAAYDRVYGVKQPPEVGARLRGANRFGERLVELRMRHRISQETLGAALGVGVHPIINYERGKNFPRFLTLIHMAAYFGVSLDWLMTGVS